MTNLRSADLVGQARRLWDRGAVLWLYTTLVTGVTVGGFLIHRHAG